MKTKKLQRTLAVLLSLLICLAMVPVTAFAEGETETTGTGTQGDPYIVHSWAALKEKLAAGGYIKLIEDITDPEPSRDSGLSVPYEVETYLDLNGCVINHALPSSTVYGNVINVAGSLTVEDSNPTGTKHVFASNGTLQPDNTHEGEDGYITVTGGIITGGYTKYASFSYVNYGGGIYVSGTFTLNSGTIAGNRASHMTSEPGGGVLVDGGTFNMNGGAVSYNSASGSGGGVYVINGTFNMTAGSIENNKAFKGGGVYVSSGTFTMSDGKISGNYAGDGGGVYLYGNDENNHTVFTMSGGEISGNRAYDSDYTGGSGAGVLAGSYCDFIMTGGIISENFSEYYSSYNRENAVYGAGVYFTDRSVFSVSGKVIISKNKEINTYSAEEILSNTYVYFSNYGKAYITVGGELENGTSIGVTVSNNCSDDDSLVFTSGYTAQNAADPSSYFTSDSKKYVVSADEATGEAQLTDAPTAIPYNLYIGGISVTDQNADDVFGDGTVSYDDESHTLTLNGATLKGADSESGLYGVINSKLDNLTIKLTGDNVIDGEGNNDGIDAAGGCNVTITGDGTLSLENTYYGTYIGYYDTEGADLTIENGATVTVVNSSAAGIWVNHDINVIESELSISRDGSSYNGMVSNIGGTITFTDSTVNIENPKSAIHMGNGDDSNHKVIINSGDITLNSSEAYGIYCEPENSDGSIHASIEMNGGVLSITSESGATNIPIDAITTTTGIGITTGNDWHSAGNVVVSILNYTINFDPGTGTGTMEPVTVNAGESYMLPDCTFTHTNSERTFYKWSVGDELKDPGDTITVNADTTVKALWQYTKSQTIDNSVDRSVTEVIGHLILRDTRTGEERTEDIFDEVTASAFTEPSNPTVNAMITEAQEALSQKAQEYAGESTVTTVKESVSDPQITKTTDSRTFTYFDNGIDDAGDYYRYLIIDGSYLHCWQYTVTLEAEYESEEGPDMSYLHILPGEGGSFSVSYEGKTSDDQPWEMSEGTPVTVTAIPDEGYSFKGWYKGDVNGSSYEEMLTDELLSSDVVYTFTATGYPYLCPVFEEDSAPAHPGDQVQMWVGNTEVVGPNSSAQGGKVAVKYTPSYDDYPEIQAKDGTDYVAGEILQFYKGDECTVYAKPDEGYRFVGWYHVNIEWAPGETLAWEGSVISAESSFTYKPGVTVLSGDTEPLRYVCAVFEKVTEDTPKLGDVNGDGDVTMLDVVMVQRAIAELVKLTDEQTKSADVNGDGKVTMEDVVLIQKYIASLITKFPAET